MQPKNRQRKSITRVILVIGVWLIFAAVLAYNRQGILDSWSLHNYHAPSEVASLVTQDTLTAQARKIFYVNQPVITAQAAFTDNCPSGTERTVVLGCYHGNQAGIYVLKVTDPRLQGVEQVTAAHEMLHAAYDRLSKHQKQTLDAMLTEFYLHGLTDPVVKQQISDYQHSEPLDVTNEMHSLFGTEIMNLPTNLEQYYAKYFTARQTVVGLYNQYQEEFTSRQNTIKADDAQLSSLKTQIDTSESSLTKQAVSLDSQRSQLDTERASGNVTAYNAAVPGFNAAVDSYNSQAAGLRTLIANYNSLVQSRNAVAAETNQLTDEISNKVPTVQ